MLNMLQYPKPKLRCFWNSFSCWNLGFWPFGSLIGVRTSDYIAAADIGLHTSSTKCVGRHHQGVHTTLTVLKHTRDWDVDAD